MPKDNQELERYLKLTPKSKATWEEAKKYLPGGDTRSAIFWEPYPLYINHGEGCRVRDVDGRLLIDFINNMTSLILGHAPPKVVKAIQEQSTHGFVYNAPNEYMIRLAKILCQRVPSIDLIRFTNSGTEGTMNAIRGARAFTGKSKIAKIEGGYHGTHDVVSVSVRSDPTKAGDPRHPRATPSVGGLPKGIEEQVVVLPFNDTEASQQILEQHKDELACVILEPILGGSGALPAEKDYLTMLREFTRKNNIVLIFDEVISFRVAPGGAQEYYGITPDMTTLGKIIGGGFPVGAFGGRRDIMEVFDPTKGPKVSHSGTFNANPMTMLAGAITMEELTPDKYRRMTAMTERLKEGVRKVAMELEVPVQTTGVGSLFGIHFTDKPLRNFRDVAAGNKDLQKRVFWGMLNEGILVPASMVGAMSTVIGEKEVDTYVEAFGKVLQRNR